MERANKANIGRSMCKNNTEAEDKISDIRSVGSVIRYLNNGELSDHAKHFIGKLETALYRTIFEVRIDTPRSREKPNFSIRTCFSTWRHLLGL